MDMRTNMRRKVLTHGRINFSQSETSLFLRGGGGGIKILSFYGGGGGGGELTGKILKLCSKNIFHDSQNISGPNPLDIPILGG